MNGNNDDPLIPNDNESSSEHENTSPRRIAIRSRLKQKPKKKKNNKKKKKKKKTIQMDPSDQWCPDKLRFAHRLQPKSAISPYTASHETKVKKRHQSSSRQDARRTRGLNSRPIARRGNNPSNSQEFEQENSEARHRVRTAASSSPRSRRFSRNRSTPLVLSCRSTQRLVVCVASSRSLQLPFHPRRGLPQHRELLLA